MPTFKSHRGTIGYIPGARKQRSASEKSFVDLELTKEKDDVEDALWFAQDISDSFVLPPSEMEPCAMAQIQAAQTGRSGRSRFSKPLPSVPRLSIQVGFF